MMAVTALDPPSQIRDTLRHSDIRDEAYLESSCLPGLGKRPSSEDVQLICLCGLSKELVRS